MPELLDHVAYLSQEIGPRPAGTEEEQQAALYITEQMQKEAGLSAVIEDFNGVPSVELARAICCGVALVFTIASFFLPVLGVATIVATLITALLFAAEAFDHPLLSRALARGVSQNVVAKYEPPYSAEAGGTRRRKVIVVARYDSGKVRPELNGALLPAVPVLQWATLGAMVLLPILLIVRNVVFLNAEGVVAIVLNVLVGVLLVLAALPLLYLLLHKVAAYNEGANCNAAGTAVLLEVARRVGRGRVSEADLPVGEGFVHGEEAARASGLVPEGAQLVYEAANVTPPEPAPQTPEARLMAAKAAIAALSGTPVSSGVMATDISKNLVQVKEQPLAQPTDDDYRELRDETREALTSIPPDTMQAALANAEAAAAQEGAEAAVEEYDAVAPAASGDERPAAFVQPTLAPEPDDGVPDWFKKAQEKAKKPRDINKPVQRSRYASALDAAVRESAGHFAEANLVVEQKLEQSFSRDYDGIREVKAPQWATAATPADEQRPSEAPAPAEGEATAQATPADARPDVTPAPASQDPFATTAMPPIDVNSVLDELPDAAKVAMPSFMDPLKVQDEKRASYQMPPRSDNRVDVTAAPIGSSGRIEQLPPSDARQPSDADAAAAARKPIVLPDIGVSATNLTPITELTKQRAPLADVESSAKSAAKSLLTMLPSISVADAVPADDAPALEAPIEAEAPAPAPAAPAKKASLRSVLPSLSGALGRADDGKPSSVSAAGAFVPAGATGTFAPVGDELLENVDPDDIYVDDADDSAYDESLTETGAFAGPGYVEMPKSRARRLFDRFRGKGKQQEETTQEWLDVDESFDAREVGAQRGGWESFREDGEDVGATTQFDPQQDYFEEDRYDGTGAQPGEPFYDDFDADDARDDFEAPGDGRRRPWHGGAFSPRRMESAEYNDDPADFPVGMQEPQGVDAPAELKQIYQFRNPDISTEVWFVALGSELAQNSGMRAFLAEHQQDLRGSIIIDLEALGAGDLCAIEREGSYRTVGTPSRMKRYVKKASQASGMDVGSAQIRWGDSAASFALKHGFQALHLAGMAGAKPAFFAQGNDVMENIDDEMLHANADFVMELLKNI